MMRIKIGCLLLTIAWLANCSKSQEPKKPQPGTGSGVKPIVRTVAPHVARSFDISKYSDKSNWSSGVNIRSRDQFFIKIGRQSPTPFRIGHLLKMATAGAVRVLQVYRQDGAADASIFVKVDGKLDPGGDGYPHPVRLIELEIIVANYSDGSQWKNGIHLQKAGTLFFTISETEATPLQAGDRLVFHQAGTATVKAVSRFTGPKGRTNIIVTVDKPLDPVGDGAPHNVRCIFN